MKEVGAEFEFSLNKVLGTSFLKRLIKYGSSSPSLFSRSSISSETDWYEFSVLADTQLLLSTEEIGYWSAETTGGRKATYVIK